MLELHDHLGGQQAIWVGHDWGSVIAGALAAHHPERARGIVLVSVPYFPTGNDLQTLVPLVDRTIYPIDRYPDGQWDYYRYYTRDFEAAVADLDPDKAASLASIFPPRRPRRDGQARRHRDGQNSAFLVGWLFFLILKTKRLRHMVAWNRLFTCAHVRFRTRSRRG